MGTRGGIGRAPVDRRGAVRRRRLIQLIIAVTVPSLAYLLVFGASAVESLQYAFTFGELDFGEVDLTGTNITEIFVWNLIFIGVVIGLTVTALRVSRRYWPGLGQWPWSPERTGGGTVFGAIGLVMVSLVLGDLVLGDFCSRPS